MLTAQTHQVCGVKEIRRLRAEVVEVSVDKRLAVDPAVIGRRLAARRLAAATVDVEFVGLYFKGPKTPATPYQRIARKA